MAWRGSKNIHLVGCFPVRWVVECSGEEMAFPCGFQIVRLCGESRNGLCAKIPPCRPRRESQTPKGEGSIPSRDKPPVRDRGAGAGLFVAVVETGNHGAFKADFSGVVCAYAVGRMAGLSSPAPPIARMPPEGGAAPVAGLGDGRGPPRALGISTHIPSRFPLDFPRDTVHKTRK